MWGSPRCAPRPTTWRRCAFGDSAEIELTVERLGRSSISFRYQVWRGAEEARPRTLCANGKVVCAVVDLSAFKSVPVPEAHRGAARRPRRAGDLSYPELPVVGRDVARIDGADGGAGQGGAEELAHAGR